MQKEKALEILKMFKTDFAEEFGVVRIGLFGSTVRDAATTESDVDVVVETKTPNMFAMVHMKNLLENFFGTHVDIVRYREKMNPSLKKNIEKEAVFV